MCDFRTRCYRVTGEGSLLPIHSHLIGVAAWTPKAHIEKGLIGQIRTRQRHIPGTPKADDGRVKVGSGNKLQAGCVVSRQLKGRGRRTFITGEDSSPACYNDLSLRLNSNWL
jgi:hypothetical protein